MNDDYPLRQTLTKISKLNSYVRAGLGQPKEADWFSPAALFAPQSPLLAELLTATQRRFHTEAATTTSGSFIQEYQWPLLSTAIACFLVDRRVPNLCPANVQLRLPTEENEEDTAPRIHYLAGRFAALPADLAADHSDAQIVPDLAALRQYLRRGIEAHMGWVIQQLCQQTGCSGRGLWLCVADRCASTLNWLMQEQDKQTGRCGIQAEINALIGVAGSPLAHKKIGLFELTYKDCTQIHIERATCCYWYKTDGGDYCTTCPHRTKEDRNERLLQYMAEEYEKVQAGR